jgi:hypothetical protein
LIEPANIASLSAKCKRHSRGFWGEHKVVGQTGGSAFHPTMHYEGTADSAGRFCQIEAMIEAVMMHTNTNTAVGIVACGPK